MNVIEPKRSWELKPHLFEAASKQIVPCVPRKLLLGDVVSKEKPVGAPCSSCILPLCLSGKSVNKSHGQSPRRRFASRQRLAKRVGVGPISKDHRELATSSERFAAHR